VFIWGHEQCSKISNITTFKSFLKKGIWNMCIMLAMIYLMGRKIEHYSLTMNPTRHLGIQNGVVFSSSPLKESYS
jgi:hypothetical protein